MKNNLEIILASTSPYRRELLSQLGIEFKVVAPNYEEIWLNGESPYETVKRLSEGKAKSVLGMGHSGIIIGSDQVYVFDGKIGGKNRTIEEAREKLLAMRGKEQEFITGLCIINSYTNKIITDYESVIVKLSDFTEDELDSYLALNEAMDCAGSIKIEGRGIVFVDSLIGDYFTLRGLPMYKLIKILKNEGVNFF